MTLDPDEITCGPATTSVRALARAFREVDWFAPSMADQQASRAHMDEHLRRVRSADADAVPSHVEVTHQIGGWAELTRLADVVRAVPSASSYDWKYGVLKVLGKAHSKRLGWSPLAHARAYQQATPSPTDLFVVIGDRAFWQLMRAPLPTGAETPTHASWYAGFAFQDAIEAIEWQLAKASDDTSDNPFVPLLELYESSVYPFALAADRMVLLHFTPE